MYPGLTTRTFDLRSNRKTQILAIRTRFLNFPSPPKCKEIHFKTVNKIYPSNEFIRNRFKLEVDNCHLCTTNTEITEHLFFACNMVQNIWKSLHNWLSTKFININFFYSLLLENKQTEFLINNIINADVLNPLPSWNALKNDISLLYKCMKVIENPHAKKFCSLISQYNLYAAPC